MQNFFYFAHLKPTFLLYTPPFFLDKCTHSFLQNIHNSLFILHIYSIKYSFFPTIISLTDHHPTTQPPLSSHTTTQPPSHSTKPPSMKFTYPFNRATIITIINLPKSKDPKIHLTERVRDGGKGQREWGTTMTWAITRLMPLAWEPSLNPLIKQWDRCPEQQDWATSAWALSIDRCLHPETWVRDWRLQRFMRWELGTERREKKRVDLREKQRREKNY